MKSTLKVIDRILEKIAASQTICVTGHVRPDGDCIGSQLGLTLALLKQGKDVACWNEDVTPQKYAFLDADKLLQKPVAGRQFDLVIATDCASFERMGGVAPEVGRRKFLGSFHRYRLVPICHNPAGHLPHRRRIGQIGRPCGHDLP